jgi:hypothetical protein
MKINTISLLVVLGMALTVGIVLAEGPQAGQGEPRQGCRMQQRAESQQGGGCSMQGRGQQGGGCNMQGQGQGCEMKQAGACPKGEVCTTENCPKSENCAMKGTDQCPKQNGTCPKQSGNCPKQGAGKGQGHCAMNGQSAGPGQVASWPTATVTGTITELAQAPGAPVTFMLNNQKVLVGSPQAVKTLELALANGQQVTVTGWTAAHSGRTTIITGAITLGEKTYTIRDAGGRPVWAGQKAAQGKASCH